MGRQPGKTIRLMACRRLRKPARLMACRLLRKPARPIGTNKKAGSNPDEKAQTKEEEIPKTEDYGQPDEKEQPKKEDSEVRWKVPRQKQNRMRRIMRGDDTGDLIGPYRDHRSDVALSSLVC